MNARDEIDKRLIACLDLTSLGEDDRPGHIRALCERANTRLGPVAAVCVYPEHIVTAAEVLARCAKKIRVATVVNFPDGSVDIDRAARETRRVLAVGAQEVDLVFPYRDFLAGHVDAALAVVQTCREITRGRAVLKVILESGVYDDPKKLRAAADAVIALGADFIKTSTGKLPQVATVDAAWVMLESIHDSGKACGLKVSGGIRTRDDAQRYLQLAEEVMGADWPTPDHFRIGASALLDELLQGQSTVVPERSVY